MKRISIILFLVSLSAGARAQSGCPIIARWLFDESSGTTTTTEEVSLATFALKNNYNKPERVTGVAGNALRFDGFSTWAYGNFSMPATTSFSISVWYATESYPTTTAAIINQQESNKGFAIELDKYGALTFLINASGTKHAVTLDTFLPKYQWNLITASVDLEKKNLQLTLNNNVTKTVALPVLTSFDWSGQQLKIGVHNQTEVFAGLWPTGVLNGLIDEVTIYGCAISQTDVDSLYDNNLPVLPPDLSIPSSRHINDAWRPRYHAMPPTSWTNEPYGLIYHEGYYHLFYQKNPNGPYHRHMHWGHLRSKDLVSWEDQRIALAPQPGWDREGIWSGFVVKDDADNIRAFYTGVDGAKAGMGLAYANADLTEWSKDVANPLIPNPPSTYDHLDFRDPMVWKYNGLWYMIVGSGIRDVGGILMTYTSTDMLHWQITTPLYFGRYQTSGRFWEMPCFIQASNDKWVLIVNTVPSDGNPAETIYWVGSWTGGKFIPEVEQPRKFDIINGPLLAPSINLDEAGRITAIGIIPETRNSESQNRSGWTHIYSLPRVLRLLDDGNLAQMPHPNLCRLRTSEIENISSKKISSGTINNLPNTTGDNLELSLRVVVESEKFTLRLRKSDDGYEYTDVTFDEVNNKIVLDRTHSSISAEVGKDIREGNYVFAKNDTLDIQVFVDHSAVEIFVDGVASLSTRIYPTLSSSKQYDIFSSNGDINLLEMHAWTLDTASTSSAVCEPVKTRTRFRVEEVITHTERDDEQSMHVYPNPSDARRVLNIESAFQLKKLRLLDVNGKVLHETSPIGRTEYRLTLSDLCSGIYLLEILTDEKIFYQRILISPK